MTAGAGHNLGIRNGPSIAQWQGHHGEFFVRYRTLYSTHSHLLAHLDHLTQAAAELDIR